MTTVLRTSPFTSRLAINARCAPTAKASALGGAFSTDEISHIRWTPPKPRAVNAELPSAPAALASWELQIQNRTQIMDCRCFRDSEVRTGPVASAAIFGIGHSCMRNENCDRALNAPTKALKNARIRRPFKGNKQWLAADVRGYETAFPGPLWHSYPTRTRIAGEETDMSGHVSRT